MISLSFLCLLTWGASLVVNVWYYRWFVVLFNNIMLKGHYGVILLLPIRDIPVKLLIRRETFIRHQSVDCYESQIIQILFTLCFLNPVTHTCNQRLQILISSVRKYI